MSLDLCSLYAKGHLRGWHHSGEEEERVLQWLWFVSQDDIYSLGCIIQSPQTVE